MVHKSQKLILVAFAAVNVGLYACGGMLTVPDECDPKWTAGACPTGYTCHPTEGVCVVQEASCSPVNPGGVCPQGKDGLTRICVAGRCTVGDPTQNLCQDGGSRCDNGFSCQVDDNQNKHCVQINDGDVDKSCSPENPDGLCQDDMVCLEGYCYRSTSVIACDPVEHPDGWCPDDQQCTATGCTVIEDDDKCPEIAASDQCGECQCPAWHVCVSGECVFNPPQCSDYGCPLGYECVDGECKEFPTVCSIENPTGFCEAGCDCFEGACVCQPITCSDSNSDGYCGGMLECIDGNCSAPACAPGVDYGTCPDGQECASGTCRTAPCGTFNPAGDCGDQNSECDYGVCVLAPCTPVTHPDGYCAHPDYYCNNGVCTLYDCDSQHPQGYCPTGEICEDDFSKLTFGTCVEGPCDSANPDGTCPVGLTCLESTTLPGVYDCRQGPCSDQFPDGVCSYDQFECLCQKGSTCTVDPVSCSPNAPVGEDCFVCRRPPCDADHAYGECEDGKICQYDAVEGFSCQSPACDANHPQGYCSDGRLCINGRCTATNCIGNPSKCDQLSEECNTDDDVCELIACSDSKPLGKCDLGTACTCAVGKTCDIDSLSCTPPPGPGESCWECRVPDCSSEYPGGVCNNVDCANALIQANCLPENGCQWKAGCVGHSACDDATDFDSCTDTGCEWQSCTDTRICAGGECVRPACGIGYPQGSCPANSECQGDPPQCELVDCDIDHPQGKCPAGTICLDGSCQVPECSSEHPYGVCPTGELCDRGNCKELCTVTHDGFCPGSLICVDGLCLSNCVDDYDCDGIPNSVETNDDFDRDGYPNSRDRDSDGDFIPDDYEYDRIYHYFSGESNNLYCPTLPCDHDVDGYPDYLDLDSDGDWISDRAEVGPVPLIPFDHDQDGIPDHLDVDSDGDGVLDEFEVVDFLLETPADDHDEDGVPSYLDLDSDGDGISDSIEVLGSPWDDTTLDMMNPANHDSDGLIDSLDLDSDGDGAKDSDEDVNGDGLVNCQLDGRGYIVYDSRYPATTGSPSPQCTNYEYNPGCQVYAASHCTGLLEADCLSLAGCTWDTICQTISRPCILSETSRIHPESDLDQLEDTADGIYLACGSQNVKPVSVYYSADADYSLALESNFNRFLTLTYSGNQVGATFDELYTESGAHEVAGFIIATPPDSTAISIPWSTPATEQEKINKAIAQAEADKVKIESITTVTNVQEVFKRFLVTFDGYGTVVNRYRVELSGPTEFRRFRNDVVRAVFGGTPSGLSYSALGQAYDSFTLLVQTIYRYDDGVSGGRVITLGSVVAESLYRSCGAIDQSDECDFMSSCEWSAGKCQEFVGCSSYDTRSSCMYDQHCVWNDIDQQCQRKQLPMFFADNLASGSSVSQYGDTLGVQCQTMVQEQGLVDFIWVVDESGSMQEEIDQVKAAAQIFFPLLENSEADYHVAITTTFLRPDDTNCIYYPPDMSDNSDYLDYHAGTAEFLCGNGVESENDEVNASGDTSSPYCYYYDDDSIFKTNQPPDGEAGEFIGQFTIRKPLGSAADCSGTNPPGYCYNCTQDPFRPHLGCSVSETFSCPDCEAGDTWIVSPYCHFASHLPCDFRYHGHEFGLWMGAWAIEKARLNPMFENGVIPSERQLRTMYPDKFDGDGNVPLVMVFLSDEEARFLKTGDDAATDLCLNASLSSAVSSPVADPADIYKLAGVYQDVYTCGDINGKPIPSATVIGDDERSCRQNRLAAYYNELGVVVFAIVGPKGTKCEGSFDAEQGDGYIAVAEGTQGGYGSICDENLYPTIESTIVSSLAIASPYKLEGNIDGENIQPIASTIKVASEVCENEGDYPNCANARLVKVLSRSREGGFDYDSQQNKLILYGLGRVRSLGDVTVSYRYWIDKVQPPTGGDGDRCEVLDADEACPETWSYCAVYDGDQATCDGTLGCHYDSGSGFCQAENCVCPAGTYCDAAATGVCLPDPSCADACPPSCGTRLTESDCLSLDSTRCAWVSGECVVTDGAWRGPCYTRDESSCESDDECRWNIDQCEVVDWEVCLVEQGICTCDVTCGGSCNQYELCDGDVQSDTCGRCFCDQSCGGGCPAGTRCDSNTDSETCGQCQCDPLCGNLCDQAANEVCNTDLSSPTCGLCQPDPTCCGTLTPGPDGDCCPDGYVCDPLTGECVCDTTCGGLCTNSQKCDVDPNSLTCGQCICDPQCGLGCPTGQCCDDNSACSALPQSICSGDCQWNSDRNECQSITCGTCIVDQACCNCEPLPQGAETCCPEGSTCDPNTGLCSIEAIQCDDGYVFDPLYGKCVWAGG